MNQEDKNFLKFLWAVNICTAGTLVLAYHYQRPGIMLLNLLLFTISAILTWLVYDFYRIKPPTDLRDNYDKAADVQQNRRHIRIVKDED